MRVEIAVFFEHLNVTFIALCVCVDKTQKYNNCVQQTSYNSAK